MVAVEHAGWLVDDLQIDPELRGVAPFGLSIAAALWIDRSRDVVHLHWSTRDYSRYMDPIPLLLAATDRSQGASLTSTLFEVGLYEGPYDDLVRGRTLFVCLRMVSIHAPLQPAIESGLFGHLGESALRSLTPPTGNARSSTGPFGRSTAVGQT
jgi:hypothetical protein